MLATMDLTSELLRWADARTARLRELGTLRIGRGPDGAGRPFASVLLQVGEADVEVLLWSTGDAEFAYGPFGEATQEHRDLASPDDLASLLNDFDHQTEVLIRRRRET